MREAGVTSWDIDYLEAQGAGRLTPDSIELKAINEVFKDMSGRKRTSPLLVGTLKPNIGTLFHATGIAQLVKAILVLQKRWLAPNIHFSKLNHSLDAIEDLTFEFPLLDNDRSDLSGREFPLVAAINTIGGDGSVTHTILSEAPLSARNSAALLKPKKVGYPNRRSFPIT